MIQKKDYLDFFNELYKLEVAMEEAATKVKEMIDNKEAKELLELIINDEIKHQKLVKEMIDLVD